MTARISLDYEVIQAYTLTLEVRDGGPNGGKVCSRTISRDGVCIVHGMCLKADNATLTVNIDNQNDNTPAFASSSYSYTVLENQINSVVIGSKLVVSCGYINNYESTR